MPKATTPAAPDPYQGQGGSYELDPATGQRRLLHRTDVAAPAAPADPQPAAPSQPAPADTLIDQPPQE